MRRSPALLACLTVLVSICVSAVVLFAAAETFLRLTRAHVGPETQRARSLEYEATLLARSAFPQMVQRKQATPSGDVEINGRGYRGPAFDVPKPPGVVRIVMLGGSSLFDMYAKERSDWPRLTERYLRARGHANVEVINAGEPGHDTADSLGRLYAEIWMFDPDYVVLYEAWNDIKYFANLSPSTSLLRIKRPSAFNGRDGGYLVTNPFIYYTGPLDRFLSHSQLYVRLRDRYWLWKLGTLGSEGVVPPGDALYPGTYGPDGPRQYALNLHLFVAAARHIGAIPILSTQARLVTASTSAAGRAKIAYEFVHLSHDALLRAFADCDKATFAVARADKVPVLDLSAMFTGQSALFEDHTHTTAAGSDAFARATAEFLDRLLGRQHR